MPGRSEEKIKKKRKCIERVLISQFSAINFRPGSYTTSPIITKSIVAQCAMRTLFYVIYYHFRKTFNTLSLHAGLFHFDVKMPTYYMVVKWIVCKKFCHFDTLFPFLIFYIILTAIILIDLFWLVFIGWSMFSCLHF